VWQKLCGKKVKQVIKVIIYFIRAFVDGFSVKFASGLGVDGEDEVLVQPDVVDEVRRSLRSARKVLHQAYSAGHQPGK
jgi:hypothetical protein